MCGGGVRNILLLLFYVCCSDCMGVCGNVCCVSTVVEDSEILSPGVMQYAVCLCRACDGCCVLYLKCDALSGMYSSKGSVSVSIYKLGNVELINVVMSGVVVHHVYTYPNDPFKLLTPDNRNLPHIIITDFKSHNNTMDKQPPTTMGMLLNSGWNITPYHNTKLKKNSIVKNRRKDAPLAPYLHHQVLLTCVRCI